MYIEDDSWLSQNKKRMLRFNHDYTSIVKPNLEKIKKYIDGLAVDWCEDFEVMQLPVEVTKYRHYYGTSAYLYAENGDLLCVVSTRIHPKDKFCRLTGRQVAQQKILARIGELNVPVYIKTPVISKINKNPKALPLDW